MLGRLVLAVILAVGISGCCVFSGTCSSKGGQVVTGLVDCTTSAAASTASALMPQVLAALMGGGDWHDILVSLESKGLEAVVCAVQRAVSVFEGRKDGTLRSGTTPDEINQSLERAHKYLAEKYRTE